MVCATFPLVWLGGLVTTHQAGMAVPDWPNTYGYNVFLYPWTTWIAGPFDLLIEHGHRLLGAAVGLLTIGFVLAVFLSKSATWRLRLLAILALLAVCAQGALGGLRVVLDQRTLAMIHGCFGPAFFAFTVALAAITSRAWLQQSPVAVVGASRVQRLAILTTILAYLQLILGAQLRHTPLDVGPGFFRAALHFHLLIAAALLVHVPLVAHAVRKLGGQASRLRVPAMGLLMLLVLQICLGAGSWVVKYGWPAWLGEHTWTAEYVVRREDFISSLVLTTHVAVGSLILALSLLVSLRACRFLQATPRRVKTASRHLPLGVAV